MITRLVKMTFNEDKVNTFFSEVFLPSKEKIRNQPGCRHLQVWQDVAQPNVVFTYSIWDSEADLDNYRNTEIFEVVWGGAKKCFKEKPQAWSCNKIVELA